MASAAETVSTGISFALSDEQKALRELARDFARNEIRPLAAEYDEHSTHPADVIAKAHEIGLMNPHIPEEYGGPGLAAFDSMLIGEELAWGCSGIATSIVANTLGSAPVLLAGTEEQQRRGSRRSSTSRCSRRSRSPSRTRARTSPASRPRPSAAATSTS